MLFIKNGYIKTMAGADLENGALLMKYEELETVIENRSIFLVCDGKKIMILRKSDMVSGNPEEFKIFVGEKTK